MKRFLLFVILFVPTVFLSGASYSQEHPVIIKHRSGTGLYLMTVSAQAANYSVTINDCRGKTITNTGSTGATRNDLPNITTIGQRIKFVLTVAQDVDINPDDSDTILVLTDAAGDAISSDSIIGSYVVLIALSLTEWMPFYGGAWADAN